MSLDCGNVIDKYRDSVINIIKRLLSQKCLVDKLPTLCCNLQPGLPMVNDSDTIN
jgi:hypothetical protein